MGSSFFFFYSINPYGRDTENKSTLFGKLKLCRDVLTKDNFKSSRKIYPNMPFIFILVIISPNLLDLGGNSTKKNQAPVV